MTENLSSIWQALEAACRALADPASASVGADWLKQFRSSQSPYEACRYILESSESSEAAKFQATGAFRDAALREWPLLGADTKRAMWHCLVQAGQLAARMPLVLESTASVAATLLKRLWGEVTTAERSALVGQIEGLPGAAGLFFCGAILLEFSPTTASAMGLPWDYHERCRKELQEDGFVLAFLKRGLAAARVTAEDAVMGTDDGICLASVKLLTASLGWDFEACSSWASPRDERPAAAGLSVRPPASWRDILLQAPSAWAWVSDCLRHLSLPTALEDALWQLVVQLCSLDGQVFSPVGLFTRSDHLRTMLAMVLPSMSFESLTERVSNRLLHACQAVLALTRVHRLKGFLEMDGSSAALDILAKVTTSVLMHNVYTHTSWAEEAGDALLEGWTELLADETGRGVAAALQPAAAHVAAVFEAACERQLADVTQSAEEDEVEYEGGEQAHSEAWLAALAFLGRASAAHCLLALGTRLDACQASLIACMQTGKGAAACLERLCWVTQLTGFLLSDPGDGETPLIPLEVLNACAAAAASGQPDPAAALGRRLLALGSVCDEAAGHPVISPRLLEEVCRTLGRWAETYLLPEENGCGSAGLVDAFGAEGGGPAACDSLVRLSISALTKYPGETVLHRDVCVGLLGPLTHGSTTVLVKCPAWAQLYEACVSRQHGVVALEVGVQRQLYQCAVDAVASAGLPQHMAAHCVEQLLEPISVALTGMASESAGSLQQADRGQSALGLLQALRGAARARQTHISQPSVFVHLATVFYQPGCILRLLEVYQRQSDIAASIVQLAADTVENHAAHLTSPQQATPLFASVGAVVASFATHLMNEAERREEQAEALEAVLHLVSALAASEAPPGVDVGAAVLEALAHVMPLATPDLLAYPHVAKTFYFLLAHVCEAWTLQVVLLPHSALLSLFEVIAAGMGVNDDAEMAASVFDAAAALARWHLAARRAGALGLAGADGLATLAALLRALLQRNLLDDQGFECIGYSAEAACFLILAEPAVFHDAANAIASGTASNDGAAQVHAAFSEVAATAAACFESGKHHSNFHTAFKRFALCIRGVVRQR